MSALRLSADDPTPLPGAEAWRELPSLPVGRWADPSRYIADQPLLDAVNTALWLGQPLLLTGEPGCGKTEFANHLAWRLGLSRVVDRDGTGAPVFEHALRFDTKSETRARDLFYSIDTIERFHAAHFEKDAARLAPLNFVRFQALGRAVLYAREPDDDVCARLERGQEHPGAPRRSVVLIDEIDKAPRDVPNDLLMEVEQMRFFMPELNRTVAAPRDMRPILVVTSNSEKALPDAFLRRCAYYHMSFPGPARLRRIIAARMDDLGEDAPLLEDAVAIFEGVRGLPLRKKPATAELLGFVQALRAAGFGARDPVRSLPGWQNIARASLLKTSEDQGRAIDQVATPRAAGSG